LGNVGGPEALPTLERAAQDAEPLIAEHAAWAIGQIRRRFVTSNSSFANSESQ
jgi:epoxyqueuosine reductase